MADQGRFSYIKMAGGIISDIREKVAISGFANTGAYGFPSAEVTTLPLRFTLTNAVCLYD